MGVRIFASRREYVMYSWLPSYLRVLRERNRCARNGGLWLKREIAGRDGNTGKPHPKGF